MYLAQGADEEQLGHEVAIGDGVERVLERASEPEGGGHAAGVERQRRAGQRPGPEWRHVGPVQGVGQPVDVAGQGPEVGQEMVGEEDGLGPLHVGVAGEVDVLGVGLARPAQQHLHEVAEAPGHYPPLPADVEPQVEGDLVVAAPPGVELGPGRAGQLGDPALHGGVDVLVERQERERPRLQLGLDPGQGGGHDRPLLLGDEPHPGQHVDVGPGAGQVVGGEAGVERQALGEVEELLGRGVAEPALPQGPAPPRIGRLGHDADPAGGCGAPWRRAQVSTDSPHSRTKPSASRWRKVSEAS